MELTGQDKETFVNAYARYQESCMDVVEAKSALDEAAVTVRSVLDAVLIAPQGGGIENWNPEGAIAASAAIDVHAEAYKRMGGALRKQAAALRCAAELATKMIAKAKEDASGEG